MKYGIAVFAAPAHYARYLSIASSEEFTTEIHLVDGHVQQCKM
jgi:hypothetical protein